MARSKAMIVRVQIFDPPKKCKRAALKRPFLRMVPCLICLWEHKEEKRVIWHFTHTVNRAADPEKFAERIVKMVWDIAGGFVDVKVELYFDFPHGAVHDGSRVMLQYDEMDYDFMQ